MNSMARLRLRLERNAKEDSSRLALVYARRLSVVGVDVAVVPNMKRSDGDDRAHT